MPLARPRTPRLFVLRAVMALAPAAALVGAVLVLEPWLGWSAAVAAGAAALLLPRPGAVYRTRGERDRSRPVSDAGGQAGDLPTSIATTLAAELPGVRVSVDARVGDELEPVALAGPGGDGRELRFGVRWGEEEVGRLRLTLIARERLDVTEVGIVEAVARTAGRAFENARLEHAVRDARDEGRGARRRERARLGAELHDRVGPELAALKLTLAARRRVPDTAAPTLQGPALARQARDAAREIAQALRDDDATALEQDALSTAITLLAGRLAPDAEPDIVVFAEPGVDLVAGARAAALYAIAAEAIANVVRHAHARSCTVRLGLGVDHVELSVGDDGVGVDPTAQPGVGLRSMRARAAACGGRLHLAPGPTGGTLLTAWVPL